jgi:hypothetical protein
MSMVVCRPSASGQLQSFVNDCQEYDRNNVFPIGQGVGVEKGGEHTKQSAQFGLRAVLNAQYLST